MSDELSLIPRHRDSGEISSMTLRRMKDRDAMSLTAKESAAGYKARIDAIDEDIARLRKEFDDMQLALLKDDLGIANDSRRKVETK